jgi:hypothetical protein
MPLGGKMQSPEHVLGYTLALHLLATRNTVPEWLKATRRGDSIHIAYNSNRETADDYAYCNRANRRHWKRLGNDGTSTMKRSEIASHRQNLQTCRYHQLNRSDFKAYPIILRWAARDK